jgi:hypothetical protein
MAATSTTSPAGANGAQPKPLPTHAQGLALFDEVIKSLVDSGWTKLRVDTYVHDQAPDWEIKHQHSAGTWELHLDVPGARRRTVKWGRHHALPTITQVLSELFGVHADAPGRRP